MKKLVFLISLSSTMFAIAQKDELKTLKKIYAKDKISATDLTEYKAAYEKLETLATEESDKVYLNFYKTMYPTAELASKGEKATMMDIMKVFTPDFIKKYGITINEVIDFEKKSGKLIYTEELLEEKNLYKQSLMNMANTANSSSKFKEASNSYYALYLFDPANEGKSLHNAAILAVQAEDLVLAEKLYEELRDSDFLKKGFIYTGVNKANGSVETFRTREEKEQNQKLGLYENFKQTSSSSLKPEIYRNLALLSESSKDFDKKKKAYAEAREISPEDQDLINGEFNLYYYKGAEIIKEDNKWVSEINASLDDAKKFNELKAKRSQMFMEALPFFEKAYSIIPSNADGKSILKSTYELLGMTEKANALN